MDIESLDTTTVVVTGIAIALIADRVINHLKSKGIDLKMMCDQINDIYGIAKEAKQMNVEAVEALKESVTHHQEIGKKMTNLQKAQLQLQFFHIKSHCDDSAAVDALEEIVKEVMSQ